MLVRGGITTLVAGARACSRPLARAAAPLATAEPAWAAWAAEGRRAMATKPVHPSLLLNNLQDNPGARHSTKRVGRGPGTGLSKTAGRGMKGTYARAGGSVRIGFEGGQTPLYRRLPKIGFRNTIFQRDLAPLNLDTLEFFIQKGRIDASKPITMKELYDANVCGKFADGVKLLARSREPLKHKVTIEVSEASAAAIEAIEALGGSVKTVYYTPLAMRALLHPEKFPIPVKSPRPPPKVMPYYTSFEKRGYLSAEVQLKELKERLAAASSAATTTATAGKAPSA